MKSEMLSIFQSFRREAIRVPSLFEWNRTEPLWISSTRIMDGNEVGESFDGLK